MCPRGVLAMEPEVLIVDELMANLDPWCGSTSSTSSGGFTMREKTILLATHDMAVVERWATSSS